MRGYRGKPQLWRVLLREQGLTTFERALDRDEKLMAVLGSRLLEPQKKVAESAEAASIELNTDFQTAGLTSMEIIAIVQAWQAGAMSRE